MNDPKEMPNPWGVLGGEATRIADLWRGADLVAAEPASGWSARLVRGEAWRDEYVFSWDGVAQGSLWVTSPGAGLVARLLMVLNEEGIQGSRALVHELGTRVPKGVVAPVFVGESGGLWQVSGEAADELEEMGRVFGGIEVLPVGSVDPRAVARGGKAFVVEGDLSGEVEGWRDVWGRAGDVGAMAGVFRGLLSPASRIRLGEPMARRTSMRVGGAAELWVEPGDEDDLRRLIERLNAWSVKWVVVGAGTNLIVSDAGIRGVVIRLSGPGFQRMYAGADGVRAGAGVYLRHIVRAAAQAGRTGLEFFEGIPGTIGGALAMNAGAMGRSFFDVVDRVRFLDDAGAAAEREGASIEVGYRHCPFFGTHIGTEVWLRTEAAESAEVEERVRTFLQQRKSAQPTGPSAGCIFRNPASNESAGRLVDRAGLKGLREGGAVVSDIHGNFILNEGHASASDLVRLIDRVRTGVREKFGIDLEREVILLGEFEPGQGT